MTTPIKLAFVPGSLELDRYTYRQCVDLVKSKRPVRVVSYNEPGLDPAFIHYIENSDKPFAVVVYYQQQKARYFILMKKIPLAFRAQIRELEKEHAKQDKPSHFIPTPKQHKPKTGARTHPWRGANRSLTIRPRDTSTPFRSNRRSKA